MRVHRETQTGPVHRCPEQTKLVDDRGAYLLVPRLDPRGKTLASQLLFGRAFASELLLDDVLGCDRRVVVARQKQHLLPRHALEARDQVVDRCLQRMAHMKLARDVGRRKAHRELRLVAGRVRHKQRVCFPARVPAGLDGLRVERLGHITLGRGHVFHPLDWLGDAGAMVAVSASEPARVRIRALRGS